MVSKKVWSVVGLCLALFALGMVPAAGAPASTELTPPECPEGFHETAGDVWAWGPRFRMLPNNGSAWQDPTLFLDASGWFDIAINNSTGDIWVLNYHDSRIVVLPYNGSSWEVRPRFPSYWEGSYALSVNSNTGDVWAIDYSGMIAMLEGGTGASWQIMPSPGNQLSAWYTVSVNSSTGEVWVINRFDGRTFVLPNGGANWQEEPSLPSSGVVDDWKVHWFGLSVNSNTGEVWALRGDGKVMMLPNGGESWQEKPPVSEDPSVSEAFFKVSVNSNTGDVWVVSSSGVVRMLPNGGTWQDKPHLGSTNWSGVFVVAPSCRPIDTSAPTADPTQSPTVDGTGWNTTNVTVTWNWADEAGGSGIDSANCTTSSVSSGEGNPITLNATCKDLNGNEGSDSYPVHVDQTSPTLTWNGGPAAGGIYSFGFVPAAPICTAADTLSGPNGCVVSGYGTGLGSHTLAATAHDVAGNSYSETRSYTVAAWTLKGFYQPVDMGGVWNTVKSGATVPFKFEVLAGSTELTDPAHVTGFTATGVACPSASSATDDIEMTTTGGTSLRYDTTSGQFIYNWQTPKKAGACYNITMTTMDGSTLQALFKLK